MYCVFSIHRFDSMKSLCDRFNKAIDSMVQMVNIIFKKKNRFFFFYIIYIQTSKGLYLKWVPFVRVIII